MLTATSISKLLRGATIAMATVFGLWLFASPIFAGMPDPSAKQAQSVQFCNQNNITIPEFGPATTYPSSISVSGLSGTISNLTVSLHQLGHDFWGDMDMLM